MRQTCPARMPDEEDAPPPAVVEAERLSAALLATDPAVLHATLRDILRLVAEDEETTVRLGAWGAHQTLLKLLAHSDETIAEAASEVVEACTAASPPGAPGFPMRRQPWYEKKKH